MNKSDHLTRDFAVPIQVNTAGREDRSRGEDRLRELAGLSERVRSGVDAGVVSTSQTHLRQ